MVLPARTDNGMAFDGFPAYARPAMVTNNLNNIDESSRRANSLLKNPAWSGSHLGQALPDSIHAVSMALPRWQDVVGYEEKNIQVMSRLTTGYPRFVIHPLVEELARRITGTGSALPFPSAAVAELAAAFVRRTSPDEARIISEQGAHAVASGPAGYAALKLFWQHTGLIVSSREAQARLQGRKPLAEADAVRRSLRRQLAQWYGCGEDDVFLMPTGMAAQYAALRAINTRSPGRPTAQLGFPYVDTLKLQQRLGHGGILLPHLGTIEEKLESLLQRERLGGCFCEIPGNPLLGCADLRLVSPLLRKHGVPLVADDVVATPFNIDLGDHADLVATSLTKFIAGNGDVMGGALICNPKSPLAGELKALIRQQHEELLWPEDALVLDAAARGFPERMRRHNEGGLYIAEKLRSHAAVERVWYPKWEFSAAYESVRRPGGGWGALITFLPVNAAVAAPRIYDKLPLCKGPSLGTIFTLACPFTLLAHYTELDWAESCGVPRDLIRLSVGLEDPAELWVRIETGLAAA